jgi:hypothetical protein
MPHSDLTYQCFHALSILVPGHAVCAGVRNVKLPRLLDVFLASSSLATYEDNHISLDLPKFGTQFSEPIIARLTVLPNVGDVEPLKKRAASSSTWWLEAEAAEESGLVRFRFKSPTAKYRAVPFNRITHGSTRLPVLLGIAPGRVLQNEKRLIRLVRPQFATVKCGQQVRSGMSAKSLPIDLGGEVEEVEHRWTTGTARVGLHRSAAAMTEHRQEITYRIRFPGNALTLDITAARTFRSTIRTWGHRRKAWGSRSVEWCSSPKSILTPSSCSSKRVIQEGVGASGTTPREAW